MKARQRDNHWAAARSKQTGRQMRHNGAERQYRQKFITGVGETKCTDTESKGIVVLCSITGIVNYI